MAQPEKEEGRKVAELEKEKDKSRDMNYKILP